MVENPYKSPEGGRETISKEGEKSSVRGGLVIAIVISALSLWGSGYYVGCLVTSHYYESGYAWQNAERQLKKRIQAGEE